ncbi:MAG: histidinol-phosphatase HisJ family protein [Oscillibacter sp.]|nr:histidinol-phosphatase HisJ family protein [Oscillibacter sp.]
MRGSYCSVHTHSRFCDGENTLAEMAQAAFEAGVVSFGASGHCHTPMPEDQGCVLPVDMTAYREEVLRLRGEYAGRMDVLLGIELDNCADVTPEGFDYWIGSVHRLRDSEGNWHMVDWDAQTLKGCLQSQFTGNSLIMIRSYYDEVCRMAARKPTVLGHIDLIAKFNEDGYFFDEDDSRYRFAALEALHAADPGETLLEINTGAMSRGYRSVPYPALFLLREWRDMGGSILLSADAHRAGDVVYGYVQAAELARAAGYERSALLTHKGREERALVI